MKTKSKANKIFILKFKSAGSKIQKNRTNTPSRKQLSCLYGEVKQDRTNDNNGLF